MRLDRLPSMQPMGLPMKLIGSDSIDSPDGYAARSEEHKGLPGPLAEDKISFEINPELTVVQEEVKSQSSKAIIAPKSVAPIQ